MFKKTIKALSVVLILAIFATAIGIHFKVKKDRAKLTESFASTIEKIEKTLPGTYSGVINIDKNSATMPKLCIDGTDYVGILEYEKGKRKFPVFADFSKSLNADVPARYYGDAESGTLVIAGRNEEGQFDFFDNLDVGDNFGFTDVYGDKYEYKVAKIEHLKTTDYSLGFSNEYELSLFVRAGLSETVVVRLKYGKS